MQYRAFFSCLIVSIQSDLSVPFGGQKAQDLQYACCSLVSFVACSKLNTQYMAAVLADSCHQAAHALMGDWTVVLSGVDMG